MEQYIKYSISNHFADAVENEDYSGLNDSDLKELKNFLQALPNYHHHDLREDVYFDKCEVTGLYADCLDFYLHGVKF
jgi:hemerythrin-like domain-containing protein